MADVKINLEAVSGQFTASLAKAQQAANALTAQLATLQAANAKLTASTQHAATAQKQFASSGTGSNASVFKLATAIGLATAAFNTLFDAAKRAGGAVRGAFEQGVTNLDDFKKATISSAAAITNIADMSGNAGKTYEQVFNRNLEATKQIFIELEKLSAKYFATSIDLQLAYNTFAQRGIIIRRSELPLLAQLTDQILLLTQGQQSTIQIQEEIRSLVNGTLRTTAQLSQLIKGYGLDVKEIAAQIKATGSLVPLEGILRGAQAATNEIQKTFIATYNGLEVAVKQIGRLGLEQFYAQLIRSTQRFTDLLQTNKTQIVGLLSAIGKAASNILDDISAAVTQLFKFDSKADTTFSGFVNFLAGVETATQVMIRSIQVLINLFGLLPDVIDRVGDAISIALTPGDDLRNLKKTLLVVKDAEKQAKSVLNDVTSQGFRPGGADGQFDAAQNRLFLVQSELSKVENQIDRLANPISVLARTISKGIIDLPWGKGVKEFGSSIEDVIADVTKAFKPLTEFSIRGAFDKSRNEIQGAKIVGEASAKFQLDQPVVTNAPTRRGYTPTADEISDLERLTNSLTAATDRYNRAARTAAQTEMAGQIEVELDTIKRATALATDGFEVMEGVIVGLRSNVQASFEFIGRNIQSFITGVRANFQPLIDDVARNTSQTTSAVYEGLKQQFDAAVQGLEDFKEKTEEASVKLRETEVAPHTQAATKLRREAEEDFARAVQGEEEILKVKREAVVEAEKLGDARAIADAKALLAAEELEKLNIYRVAQDKRLIAEQSAAVQAQIAVQNNLKIGAQAQTAIASEATRLEKEKLRILHDQELVYGRILKQNAEALASTQRLLVSAKRQGPTTDLESGDNAINDQREKFALDTGEAVGKLQALRREYILGGDVSEVQILQQERHIESLKRVQDQTIATMDANNAFTTSMAAIGNAVKSAIDGFADALLGSFEGKKTDFARLGKNIADQLFKDSLKDVIQNSQKALQDGFKAAFAKLNISDDMAKTLGPAFLAGFALIASFVLGQLLGDKGGSATAGNPTVGIQSSEQVRGLIGGDTQIPIGQIAESLQDALVPTNLLLSRIVAGIDRLGGGLSNSSIESIIERSINDALQIQPA